MGPGVDRLFRRVRRLERLSAGLQDLAEDVLTDLATVRRAIAADASGRLEPAIECGLLRAAEARRKDTLRAANAGARTLEMKPMRGGAALVRIDEGKWFRLARGDARLLRVLCFASPASDGFPEWQTYQQVSDQIARKTGERPTRRALVESVYRIRRALRLADLNEFLLNGDRHGGRLRFLLRAGGGSQDIRA